jgi:predicted TIM-barrel fold metal-dependent hydrolase
VKIDAYAHILPPRYFARVDAILSSGQVSDRIRGYHPWFREDPALTDLDARWRSLEPFPDYRQVLTLAVPPLEELGDPALSRDLARAANDELAELVAAHPDRFAGFAAAVPLNDVDAALEEVDRATRDLGALGIQLHTNVQGTPLDAPRFEPLFQRVAAIDRTMWVHPTRSDAWPDYPDEKRSRYGVWWSLGWPYETSVFMARLVYAGHLERYPDLKIVTHHAGAMVPHFSGRLASPIEGQEDRDEVAARLPRAPIEYFRRFFTDSAMFGAPHAVRCATEFFGTDHVLFGTDTPLGGPRVVHDTIADIDAMSLADEDRERIYEGNSRRVLGVVT